MSVSEIVYDGPTQGLASEISDRLYHASSPQPIAVEPNQQGNMGFRLLMQS
jgi:hypothetical protein